MPPTLTDGEGQQKNSRKIKRLRDASCMRKRETKQDRWGRQRGGRKARWDKLDRQPSALRSRLRLVNSAAARQGVDHDSHLDAVEEAFTFVDTIAVVASAAGVGNGSSVGCEGDLGSPAHSGVSHESKTDFEEEFAIGSADSSGRRGDECEDVSATDEVVRAVANGERLHPSSPGSAERQAGTEMLPKTPTAAAASSRDGDGKVDGAVSVTEASTPPPDLPGPTASCCSSSGLCTSGHSSGGIRSSGSFRAKAGGSAGRHSSLRSPGGLLRSGSVGGGGGGGLGSGSYRGSPPPLHRRLSSPAGVGSSKKSQKQRHGAGSTGTPGRGGPTRSISGLGSAKKTGSAKKKQMLRSSTVHERNVEEEEMKAATPPPPPSLFESVFKDKLPSLTPRKAPPPTPRLSRDSIVHAIFQSLFGKRKVRSGPRERYGGDWDDVDDDEDESEDQEEEVDESWIKNGINLTLFNSKAVDFACRSTAGADLLHQYVDSNAVFRLVTDLRFEDPRVPSPRLMILKAIYENCAHLRLPTLRALAHASHDHLMRTRELEDWAAKAGVDIAEAAAAAVADGVAAKRGGGGGGSGGVGGGNARVTGRDQSQTMCELLLFVLETFSKYFLGMVSPDEENEQPHMMEQGGISEVCNTGGGGCGVDATGAHDCRSPTPAPCQGSVLSPQAMPMATSPPQELGSSSETQSISGPDSGVLNGGTPENRDRVSFPEENAGEGSVHCVGGVDTVDASQFVNDGGISEGEGEVVVSPGGGSGGDGAAAESAVSAGGDPVLFSDRCPAAWPSLLTSSPSSAKKRPDVGDKQDPPWSPAWATAGVRILEEHASDDLVERGERGDVLNGDHRGRGSGDGAWGQGAVRKGLVWETTAEERNTLDSKDVLETLDGGAGAARALRFTTQGEEDITAAPTLKGDSTTPNGVRGPFSGGRDLDQGKSSSPFGVTKGDQPAEVAGLGVHEWPTAGESKLSTPKRSSTPSPVQTMNDVQTSSMSGGEISVEVQKVAAQHLQSPLPSTPSVAGRISNSTAVNASAVPAPEIDLPSAALKEAARSLCNLYASHGAPAAGAEAASAADTPERLQPLAMAGSTLCGLWAPTSVVLLRRLLGTWPSGSARREVAYLRLVAGVACSGPPLGLVYPGSRIPVMLIRRLARCINSSNIKVAQEAAFLVQADFILVGYLAPDRRLMDLVTNALCANRDHWSADVRNASDQTFDLMLDFL